MDKKEKVKDLTLVLSGMIGKYIEDLPEREQFEIASNTVLNMCTYPMIFLDDEDAAKYQEYFPTHVKQKVDSFVLFCAEKEKEEETNH